MSSKQRMGASLRIALVPVVLTLAVLAVRAFVVDSRSSSSQALRTRSVLSIRQAARLGVGVASGQLLTEPGAGRRSLLRLLDRAQSRIFIEIYILTDRSVVRGLERAAAQGVRVYALVEPHALGMGTQPARITSELRAAGVHVRSPPAPFALTHAKFIVVDDRVGVISTANFSRSAFTRNREFLLVVRQRAEVHELAAIFLADWDRLPVSLVNRSIVVSPQNSRAMITALVLTARRSVLVYAEELADPALERLFASLARRRIHVQILLPRGQSPASRQLLASGVQIHALSSPYIHAKVIVVDGRTGFLGSENISAQSLDLNREVGVLLRGSIVSRIVKVFDRDWARRSVSFKANQ